MRHLFLREPIESRAKYNAWFGWSVKYNARYDWSARQKRRCTANKTSGRFHAPYLIIVRVVQNKVKKYIFYISVWLCILVSTYGRTVFLSSEMATISERTSSPRNWYSQKYGTLSPFMPISHGPAIPEKNVYVRCCSMLNGAKSHSSWESGHFFNVALSLFFVLFFFCLFVCFVKVCTCFLLRNSNPSGIKKKHPTEKNHYIDMQEDIKILKVPFALPKINFLFNSN